MMGLRSSCVTIAPRAMSRAGARFNPLCKKTHTRYKKTTPHTRMDRTDRMYRTDRIEFVFVFVFVVVVVSDKFHTFRSFRSFTCVCVGVPC